MMVFLIRINVEDLLGLGVENGSYEMNPTKFRVIGNDKSYHGEIKVGVKFTKVLFLSHFSISSFEKTILLISFHCFAWICCWMCNVLYLPIMCLFNLIKYGPLTNCKPHVMSLPSNWHENFHLNTILGHNEQLTLEITYRIRMLYLYILVKLSIFFHS